MAIICPDAIACDGNGEIEVNDIVDTVNGLVSACEQASLCCESVSAGDVIRTLVIGNILYMTNDGSDPTP